MNAIYYLRPPFLDERRREELYQDQLLVCSPQKSTPAFVEFARKLVGEAFPLILRQLNDIFPWSLCADLLVKLKPNFIHHSQSNAIMRGILMRWVVILRGPI